MKKSKIDQLLGMFIGHAIGDAVGTTIEFSSRDTYKPMTDMVGGGPFKMPVGGWTDDTSQVLATTAALLQHPSYNPAAVMTELLAWRGKGKHSHNGRCFDIGGNTSKALSAFARTGKPYQGPGSRSGGNGALCRTIPFIVRWYNEPSTACALAVDCAKLTNGDEKSLEAVRLLGNLLWNEIRTPRDQSSLDTDDRDAIRAIPRENIPSGGYAPETLLAAIWSVETTYNFRDAVLKCANLGHDADSTAAIAGALAGARYGLSGMPQEWVQKVKQLDLLTHLAQELIELGHRDVHPTTVTRSTLAVTKPVRISRAKSPVQPYHYYPTRVISKDLTDLIAAQGTRPFRKFRGYDPRPAKDARNAGQTSFESRYPQFFQGRDLPKTAPLTGPAIPAAKAAARADLDALVAKFHKK